MDGSIDILYYGDPLPAGRRPSGRLDRQHLQGCLKNRIRPPPFSSIIWPRQAWKIRVSSLADSDVMMEDKTASAATAPEEDLLQPLLRLRRRQPLSGGPDSELQRPSSSPGTVMEATNIENLKEKPLPRLNLHSAFWILASIATTYYADFFKNVKEMILQENGWFILGSVLLMISLSVAFYCIVYLEWYRGIKDYDARYPALIPVTTASFIAAAVCFNISLWPVWSFVTPLVLFVQFMGVVMLVSLLG